LGGIFLAAVWQNSDANKNALRERDFYFSRPAVAGREWRRRAASEFKVDVVFAGLIIFAVLSLLMTGLVKLLEDRMSRWWPEHVNANWMRFPDAVQRETVHRWSGTVPRSVSLTMPGQQRSQCPLCPN
jgi:hypothetical protein